MASFYISRIFRRGAILLVIYSILEATSVISTIFATLWSLKFRPWCLLHFGARLCHVIGIYMNLWHLVVIFVVIFVVVVVVVVVFGCCFPFSFRVAVVAGAVSVWCCGWEAL